MLYVLPFVAQTIFQMHLLYHCLHIDYPVLLLVSVVSITIQIFIILLVFLSLFLILVGVKEN